MADIAQIRALLEQLPITDEYGAAREVGGVLLKVLEDADRASAAANHVQLKIETDDGSKADDYADNWQPLGRVVSRIVDRFTAQPEGSQS